MFTSVLMKNYTEWSHLILSLNKNSSIKHIRMRFGDLHWNERIPSH